MRVPVNVVLTQRHKQALDRWSALNDESKSFAVRRALEAWAPLRPMLDQPDAATSLPEDRAA